MSEIPLRPGATALGDWRAIYRGARIRLDPILLGGGRGGRRRRRAHRRQGRAGLWHQHRLRQARERAHRGGRSRDPATQHRAFARGGRRRGDAARNRAADDGAETGEPRAGRLGRDARPRLQCLYAMLDRDLVPVVPSQGSVGASGDLAPLAHMAAAMIGVGEIDTPRGRRPAVAGACRGGPCAGGASAQGRARAAQRHAVLDRPCARRRSSRPSGSCVPRSSTGALSTDAARGSDAPFDPRIHALRGHRGQIETAEALRG